MNFQVIDMEKFFRKNLSVGLLHLLLWWDQVID